MFLISIEHYLNYLYNNECIGYILPPNFWIWTVLTSALVEFTWLDLIIDLIVLLFTDRLLRPLWGSTEMLVFFLVVNTMTVLSVASVYWLLYVITFNIGFWFNTYLHGLAAYVGGFTVALRQAMPDTVLLDLPLGKLRNQHVPLILLLSVIVAAFFGLQHISGPLMFAAAIYSSWLYLRFFQPHANGTRGDPDDHFTFAGYFFYIFRFLHFYTVLLPISNPCTN